MQYDHTQRAPLYLVLLPAGIALLVGAWFVPERVVQIVLAVCGVLNFLLAASFRQLTVRDEGDHLLIHFGPLSLFRRRISYTDIQRAKRSRTTFLEGWGIHLSHRGGWVWNLWGFDCVDLDLSRGRKLRIGTDDPAGLETFLKERIDAPEFG
jgi:hypothetical protein